MTEVELENIWCGHDCFPHDFRAAWASEDVGVIYCRACGDIRSLEPASVAAPAEERYTDSHTITATFEAGE